MKNHIHLRENPRFSSRITPKLKNVLVNLLRKAILRHVAYCTSEESYLEHLECATCYTQHSLLFPFWKESQNAFEW